MPYDFTEEANLTNKQFKLKSCPFCGGKAETTEIHNGKFYIQCSNCEVEMFGSVSEVIKIWNKRVIGT